MDLGLQGKLCTWAWDNNPLHSRNSSCAPKQNCSASFICIACRSGNGFDQGSKNYLSSNIHLHIMTTLNYFIHNVLLLHK